MPVVLDEYTRVCRAIEVHRNLLGKDVASVLDELTAVRGAPAHIGVHNRPEIISGAVKSWCEESDTGALYIDPGSPLQNSIVKSFDSRLRVEPLSTEIFDTLVEAWYLIDRWRLFYNSRRIQWALGKVTSLVFAATCPTLSTRRARKGQLPCPDCHQG